MTYIVRFRTGAPHFISATLTDFETKIPGIHARAEVARVFMNGTRLLKREETPEHLVLNKPRARLRDIFKTHNSALIVSEKLQALMEEMDPDLHQFMPISIDNRAESGRWFVLNVHTKQDSVVDDQSDVRPNFGSPDSHEIMYFEYFSGQKKVTLTRRLILQRWEECTFGGSDVVRTVCWCRMHFMPSFARERSNSSSCAKPTISNQFSLRL